LTGATIKVRLEDLGRSIAYPFTVSLAVFGPNASSRTGPNKLDATISSAATTNIESGRRFTFSGLKQNTHYVARLFNGSTVVARHCFRTAVSPGAMSRALGYHADIGRHASGCFAFGGTPEQVQACLCGARNSSGTWRATNGDGYDWQISAAERTRLGC